MIDTDKYEGHTPKPWGIKNAPHNVTHLYGGNDTKICSIQTPDGMFAKTKGELKLSSECNTNARLIQDAPYILQALIDERAEVKRLREELKHLNDIKDGINMALKPEDAPFNIMIEIESILHKNRWIEYDCHQVF